MAAKTVLVVDDSEYDRDICTQLLRLCGVRAIGARHGAEGVRIAREEKPALILLDVMMPGVNGFTIAEILRAEPETAGIPVVAVSAFDYSPEEARQAGCDEFARKPLGRDKLRRLVEKYVGPVADPAPAREV